MIVGQQVKFKENTLVYFQDMAWWQGVPTDIIFTVDSEDKDGYWLVADGYGMLKGGEYGNGKIHVYKPYNSKNLDLESSYEIMISLSKLASL